MLRLTIRSEGREQIFESGLPEITFGRAAENTIQVSDVKASRVHCKMERTPTGWKLVDLESSNGTSVNGEKMNARMLVDGDRVTIGAFEVVFNAPAGIAPPAPVAPPAPAPAASSPKKSSHPNLAAVHVPVPHGRMAAAVVDRENAAATGFVKTAIIAAVLLVAAVIGINYLGGSSTSGADRAAFDSAAALAKKGELDLAEKSLETLVAGVIDPALKKRAGELLADVKKQIADRDARTAKDKSDVMAAYAAEAADNEASREFEDAQGLADEALGQERFGAALDEWKRFAIAFPEGGWHDKCTERIKDVLAKAGAAWEVLQDKANALTGSEKYSEAAALVSSAMQNFQGTRFYYDAQSKILAINRISGVNASYAAAGPQLSGKVQDGLLSVGDLIKQRKYGQALKQFDAMAAGTSGDERKALDARRAEIEAQGKLFDKLIAAINDGHFVEHPLEITSGTKLFLSHATAEELEISFKDEEGKGGASSKKWFQVSAEDLLGYFMTLDPSLDEKLTLASFCFANGLSDEAGDLLNDVIRADGKRQADVFALIARQRGIQVPAGGFVYYSSGWFTPGELSVAKLDVDAKRGATMMASMDSKKAAEGYATYTKLMADSSLTPQFKQSTKDAYVKALKGKRTSIMRQLRNSRSLASDSTMIALKRELDDRRKTALKIIFDKSIYPDEDHGKVGQPKVDAAVEAVREIWERPLDAISRMGSPVGEVIASAGQVDNWLEEMGSPATDAEKTEMTSLIGNLNDVLSLKYFAATSGEQSLLESSDQINAFNEYQTTFDSEEKACILATNEYRLMMGKRALEAQTALGKAARGHSEEMARLTYFAHESPTAGLKSPGDRCAKEGYSGYKGENIEMGTPGGRESFDGWYHSSGHHRNMLQDAANQIGVGRNGTYWTMDLGAGAYQYTKMKYGTKGKNGTSWGSNWSTNGHSWSIHVKGPTIVIPAGPCEGGGSSSTGGGTSGGGTSGGGSPGGTGVGQSSSGTGPCVGGGAR